MKLAKTVTIPNVFVETMKVDIKVLADLLEKDHYRSSLTSEEVSALTSIYEALSKSKELRR